MDLLSHCICFEPIKPVIKSFYYCDKRFHLDDFIVIYKEDYLHKTKNLEIYKKYGVIFINGDEFNIYQITKSATYYEFEKIYRQTVTLAKKHNKGGQSALRFSRLQEESENNYIKIVSEKLINLLEIKQIFIVGNGSKKDLLAENELILSRFESVNTLTIANINHETIINFINLEIKAEIEKMELVESEKHIETINEIIRTNPDILTFGENETFHNLEKIKQIYYANNLNIPLKINNINKIKLIPINKNQMESIGINCIGIKYWND